MVLKPVQDGRLVNSVANSLAGAHIDLATSVRRLMEFSGTDLRAALVSATSPREMMRLPSQELVRVKLSELFTQDLSKPLI